ncbi:MAG: gliding motility-associated C-terminal domain-containing protein [Flavobacteriales bacterium]
MSPRILRSIVGSLGLGGSVVAHCACLIAYTFTSSPLPTNGTYACGQSVTFCYTVTNWNDANTNWFHGIAISFGPGWDMATLVPGAPPATCGALGGTWGWYNSVTGTATTAIGPQGPGFFFDLDDDGDPGNNFGDNCVGAVNWQFCWTINVLSPPDCINGLDLSVSVNSFGDSETGSWNSQGCHNDAVALSPPAVILACAVSAGTDAVLDLCASSPPADLFLSLGGTPNAGGSWTDPAGAPHSGVLDPSVDLSGDYTYTVASVAPPCQSQAVVTVTLQPQPDAGTDGSIVTCASDALFSLFALLGGTPDPSGTWTAPGGGASSGMFDPAIDVGGVYVYDLTGVAPCLSAQATVTVTVNPSPNAGSDGVLAICSNGTLTPLINSLGGSPSPAGSWTGPGGAVFTGNYDPAFDGPGAYTYQVDGVAPCPNSTATVIVTENALPSAGSDAATALCETGAAVPLITLLGGSPDAGGGWTGPGGSAVGATLDPATASSGDYVYSVIGTAPCPNAQATLTLLITSQPSAGSDGGVNLCDGSLPTDLFTVLGGTPSSGGVWVDPLGASVGAVFNPATSLPGIYTYTVSAAAPCIDASASVTVNVAGQSSAGVDAVLAVCSDGTVVSLLPLLGPTAQPGGAWTDPLGAAVAASFTPGASIDGVYTYTINGTAPCVTVSATVTVTTALASDPGVDGILTTCETGAQEDLFNSLGGSPAGGGTWTTPGGAPFAGQFNPATGTPGIYTYTLPVNGACPAASATVDVTVVATPDAGLDGAVSLCTNSVLPYDMITGLGGSPSAGGTWTAPGGGAHGPDLIPWIDSPGVYTYTVYAPPPCLSASSTLVVSVVQPVSAGIGGIISLCENGAPVDASTWLGGNPTAGGIWTAPGGAPVAVVDPSTAASGNYTYTVQGTAPCPDAQAVVTLTIDLLPDAGADGNLTLCDEAAPVVMVNYLGGAQPGGAWSGPGGAATGVFTPGQNVPGSYTYTVNGTGACASEQDQANMDVAILPLPSPSFMVSVANGCAPLEVEFTIEDTTGLQSADWIFGDGSIGGALVDAWHTYVTGGVFTVELEVTNTDGCVGTASITNAVHVSEGPNALFYALPLRVSESNPTTVVTQVAEPGILYTWTIDTTMVDTSGVFSWTFDPPDLGLHPICLTASDAMGCDNTYCIDVLVDDDLTIFVPNAFTPNGDDQNDRFRPSVIGVQQDWYEFMVFDRWGMLIFRTSDPYEGWNGGMDNSGDVLSQDVYVWKLRAKDQFTTEKQEYIGSVTLVK